MRKLLAFAVLLIACSAHAAPASEESIDKLLAITKTEALMESMYGSMEQVMRKSLAQAMQGKPVSEEQQRFLDGVPVRFVAVMKEELAWAKLKPQFVQLYRDTFEQEEIDGLIAFYGSPAGQALIHKMPVVMQKSMAMMQSMMQSISPKMMAAVKEALAQAKLAK